MKNSTIHEDYDKLKKVIRSCMNKVQLKGADIMIELFRKKHKLEYYDKYMFELDRLSEEQFDIVMNIHKELYYPKEQNNEL